MPRSPLYPRHGRRSSSDGSIGVFATSERPPRTMATSSDRGHDTGASTPHAAPAAPIEVFKSGDAIVLTTVGTKSAKGTVLLTKTWLDPFVGVFLEFQLAGSPSARAVLAAYITYALTKTAGKLYRIFEYGVYNPRMMNDGVGCFEVAAAVEPDGAPSRVRVELHYKPVKIGQLLATLLAKSCFMPPASALSDPALAPLGRDLGSMMWAAKQYVTMIHDADFGVMIVGGKVRSVRKGVVERFKTTFSTKYAEPAITGGKTPSNVPLQPELAALSWKAPSGVAIVAAAHPMSGYGPVWVSGTKMGVCIPTEDQKLTARRIGRALRNGHKAAAPIVWYQRRSVSDKCGTLGSALAAAALSTGLPMDIAERMLSIKSIDVEKVAEDVEKSAE